MQLKSKVMITNIDMRELQDHTIYAAVGVLSMDDGQKFDISVRDKVMYEALTPFQIIDGVFNLSNSKYGLKLSLSAVTNWGEKIGGASPTASQK